MKKPRIVVIGGGTGLPVVLQALHKQNVDITAIVTVADDGGSSGIIRNYINVVPPGDIRNVICSLSDSPDVVKDVFQYRFNDDDDFFSGHAIGNLIIAALTEMKNGIFNAVQELSELMKIDGHIYPVSNEPLLLHARFTDNSEIVGESKITEAHKIIDHVWITKQEDAKDKVAKAVPEVIDAIMHADMIVLGPGSLFTSILPNLMVKNVGDAILQTKAEIVYICNIMTQLGETDNFTDADHVMALNDHLNESFIDTVLVNNYKIPDDIIDKNSAGNKIIQVTHDDLALSKLKIKVIEDDFINVKGNSVYHDGDKIVKKLLNLLK